MFFVEWDKEFAGFIKGITLSPSLRGSAVVHIFYPQNIPEKFLPNYKPWLFKHPMPSEAKQEFLQDFVMKFRFNQKKPSAMKTTSSCCRGSTLCHYYLATDSKDKNQELVKDVKDQFGIELFVISSKENTLLDYLEFKCTACKIAFKEKKELTQHDKDFHNLLCLNNQCKHYLKQNSFSNEKDYTSHVLKQRRCKFCPGTVFCSAEDLELHMRRAHKRCSCPCGEYFGNRQTFLDHFFCHYPSPTSVTAPNMETKQKPEKSKQPGRHILQSQCQSKSEHATSRAEDQHGKNMGLENDHDSCASSVVNENDDYFSECSNINSSFYENE